MADTIHEASKSHRQRCNDLVLMFKFSKLIKDRDRKNKQTCNTEDFYTQKIRRRDQCLNKKDLFTI